MTDPARFEAFVRSYQNMVFTVAARLLGNHAEAQDIAQEVFLKAYQRFDTLADSPTAGGWLKTVATNLCLNHLSRYRKRWRFFSDMLPEEDEEGPREDFSARIAAPDHRDEDEAADDRRQLLEAALASLPAKQRVPLVLFHFDELPYEEIALRLKISLSKVKTDIARGRETLRKKLEGRLSSTGLLP
jgi:RNA polymerase sigma-70 factor, ECF subfamily